MANTNSWQCNKCGRVFYQDFPPGCCDNCGGVYFSQIGFKDHSSGNGSSSSGFFSGLIFMFLVFVFTCFFKACRWLFGFVRNLLRGSDK